MHFLKNKHLILAMFVAPALAVIAYFAVDHVVSEKPHAAVQGDSYKLKANSNCRYKSGLCTLENGDVEVMLRIEIIGHDKMLVLLSSALPLQSAVVSLVTDIDISGPIAMRIDSEEADVWSATLHGTPTETSMLRLALNISDTLYFAETSTIFIDYETAFPRENFSN
ncbi:MAG: hypothetical protein IMF15_09875 [Proteobacteria bacterium]|nr:hypothetical protein [Pseudomonadota bacterium]